MRKNLTDREFEIIEVLWKRDKPLNAAELLKMTSSISENSIHRIISHLLSKGYIKIAGTIQVSRSLSRVYTPAISAEEYTVEQMKKIFKPQEEHSPFARLFMYLASRNKTQADIISDEILKIIEKLKKKEQ